MSRVADLVFSHVVEGLFRAVGPLDIAAKARFRELGVDPDQKFAPAYPIEQYVELQRVAVALLAPGRPFDEGIELLGRRFVDGYGETLVGSALLVGLRLLGPTRALDRLSRTMATGSTFFETRLTQPEAGLWHLWVNRVVFPGWFVGLLRRGLEHAGARDISVDVVSHEGEALALTLAIRFRA